MKDSYPWRISAASISICVCFWAWSAYFRTGVIVRELHSDRILAGLDRARRQGKTLGRPKKVIDVEKLAILLFTLGRDGVRRCREWLAVNSLCRCVGSMDVWGAID
jgi:hypothetical protein